MQTVWALVVLATTGNQTVGWYGGEELCLDMRAAYHSALEDLDEYQGATCVDTGVEIMGAQDE